MDMSIWLQNGVLISLPLVEKFWNYVPLYSIFGIEVRLLLRHLHTQVDHSQVLRRCLCHTHQPYLQVPGGLLIPISTVSPFISPSIVSFNVNNAICTASSSSRSSLYLFSRKVFALVALLPIAVAFHGKSRNCQA